MERGAENSQNLPKKPVFQASHTRWEIPPTSCFKIDYNKVMRLVSIMILTTALNSFGQVEPCQDYTCDSLAVRAILDSNGLYNTSVHSLSMPVTNGRIVQLALDELGLQQLPPEIGKLNALTWLYLAHNQLTSLPAEIGQLTAMTHLSFFDNQLISIPPEIGNLTALIWLELDMNQLTTLPPTILNISPSMSFFGFNRLCILPDSIELWLDEHDRRWRETQDCSAEGCADTDYLEYNPNAIIHVQDSCKTLGIRMKFTKGPVISVSPSEISIDGEHTLKVLNVNGEVVFSGAGTGPGDYSLSEYEPGIYFVNVTAERRKVFKRVVVF
jgi:hypothetical protein